MKPLVFARVSDCGGNHIRQFQLHRRRHSQQRVQGRIPHAPFDIADHLLREPAQLGHRVHREIAALALPAQLRGYGGGDDVIVFLLWHPAS